MTQTQFLLLLISIIPFINALTITVCADSPKLIATFNKVFPLLFLINLIGIYGNLDRDNSYLVITEAARGISLGFDIDRLALGFLFLLNFFWIVFIFYSQRFLHLIQARNIQSLKIFFTLIIAFVNLIIISKNLLSILFFYNCLIILCHFFSIKFLHKTETKFSNFFTFLLYFESIFFFLAIVATYKFTGQIDFTEGGVISDQIGVVKYRMLLILYLSGLFLSVIFPCYLLYRNINPDPLVLYSLFFLSYALSSLYILVKILIFTFGLESFSLMISKAGFAFFESVFLFNIAAVSVFLLFSKGLKSSFFYLFFQQFSVALFSIFLFATFNPDRIYLTLLSFPLSITLIFLCIANYVLYIHSAKNKSMLGLFYNLKITTILFIFAIANIIGIAPGVGAVEKFFLLKVIFEKKLFLSGIIFIINFVSLGIFSWKIFYPLFRKPSEPKPADDINLAKDIDYDSSLILTALIVAIAIFLSLVFFPFLTDFL